ncbi:MAG: tetratricopeptide repeat protein [Methanomicrobiaceae archaeon]|nr:tetratricopeptide repeat protein [Methanomicrobiaceae archaeon]
MKVKTVIYTVFILLLLYFAVSTVIASNQGLKEQTAVLIADYGLENDRYEWGLSACDWVLEDSPYNTEILKRKAKLLAAAGEYEKALSVQESLVLYSPESMSADDWDTLGGLYVQTGDYKNAYLSYDEALAGYGSNSVSDSQEEYADAMEKAELLLKLQRYDEAVDVYNSVIEADPENTAAWIGIGDAYLYKSLLTEGQIEDMYASLDITRSKDSGMKESATDALKSHKKAIDAYNKAVEINPMLYPVVAGKILGNYEKTISSYQDILEGLNNQ